MHNNKFYDKIKDLFSSYEISSDYRENPNGNPSPWVEFGICSHSISGTFINLGDMEELSEILGTTYIEVTGFYNGSFGSSDDGTDHYVWVTAYDVDFNRS